jgi:hypothetical protein
MLAWLASMTWLAIAEHDVTVPRIVLIVSPLWTVFQVIRRQAMTSARRKP